MATLRHVYFWPNGGIGSQPWIGARAADAFVRTSRRVTERYSEAVSGLGLASPGATLKMMVSTGSGSEASVEVIVERRYLHARAFVPASLATMVPQERARVVLDVVDAAMATIGHECGWPQDGIAGARTHALEHGLGFDMASPWKSSPSRGRRVRLVVRLADDGWGDLAYEVAEPRGGPSLGFTRVVRTPLNSLPKLKRAWAHARWVGDALIERDEYAPPGSLWSAVEQFDVDDLRAWPVTVDAVPTSPLIVRAQLG